MKKYDVVAIVGEYTNSQGEQKPKYKNVGAVIQNTNGGLNLLLDKTFNPAGLAQPDKESVILSLFEPQQRAQQAMGQPLQQAPQRESGLVDGSVPVQQAPNDFDEDIPF